MYNYGIEISLNISEEEFSKNWHAFLHVRTPSSNIGMPCSTLTRSLPCWYVKKRGWHAGTQARWHVDHAGHANLANAN